MQFFFFFSNINNNIEIVTTQTPAHTFIFFKLNLQNTKKIKNFIKEATYFILSLINKRKFVKNKIIL